MDTLQTKTQDPYLKPVLISGLLIVFLSVLFSPAIFLWALIAGFLADRLAQKKSKDLLPLMDAVLLGLFSGLVGGALLNLIIVFTFSSFDSQRLLVSMIEKNWPSDMVKVPNIQELIPSLLLFVSLLVFLISSLLSALGGLLGVVIKNRANQK